jgi:hypothetical protein
VVVGRYLGETPVSAGFFAGISTVTVVAAMNDTNGGLYMALMAQYGRPVHVGAYSVMSLESGPFLTMLTLGVAGVAAASTAGNAAAVPTIVAAANPACTKRLRGKRPSWLLHPPSSRPYWCPWPPRLLLAEVMADLR